MMMKCIIQWCLLKYYYEKEFKRLECIFVDIMYMYSLSNTSYFTSAKKCWRKSCTIDFTSAKMEFASTIFKTFYFSKYSIKRCWKHITSIQKLVNRLNHPEQKNIKHHITYLQWILPTYWLAYHLSIVVLVEVGNKISWLADQHCT